MSLVVLTTLSHLVVDGEVLPGPGLLGADVLVQLERAVSPSVDT